jgi:hypothetical protein
MLLRQSRLPLVWLLLAAALLLRGAVPAGWMPMADEHGIRIAVCTGVGTEFLTLGDDGKLHKQAPQPDVPRDPCPFALANGAAADVPPVPSLPLARIAIAPPTFPQLAAVALAQRRYPRPPARGPPSLA